MKVLFIQGVSRYGGALKSLFYTMRLLKDEGIEPILVTSKESKLTQDCERCGIKYYTFPIGMWRKVKSWPWLPLTLYRLCKVALREKVDIVHCNTLWDSPYGIIISKILKLPVVVHLRNEHSRVMVKKYHLNLADAIVGVSFACIFGLDPHLLKKAKVVYNVADLSCRELCENSMGSDYPVISIIGRVDSTKGQVDFIETVFKRLIEKVYIILHIVGVASGKEKYLEEIIRKYEKIYKGFLFFHGFSSDVGKFYKISDVIIVPSTPEAREGVPRVVIEACVYGKPVVATDSGGTKEAVINGKTGIVVDRICDFTRVVLTLLMFRKKIFIFSNHSKIVYSKFSPVDHYFRMRGVYENLLYI